jgi:hypothetical protein
MRLIERQMNAAISNSERDWKKDNTVVQTGTDGVSRVFLFGNQIAEVGDNWIQIWDGGWQTVTTKSRLNAILREHGVPGEHIFQKKGQWFLNQEGGAIPFFSGMRLN